MDRLGDFINLELLKNPMNWAVVWLLGAIGLFAIHSLVMAFGASQSDDSPPLPFSAADVATS
jgi:hypothetical protein